MNDAVFISSGSEHTGLVRTGGQVMRWGTNTDGQLGNGTTTLSLVPVAVSGI